MKTSFFIKTFIKFWLIISWSIFFWSYFWGINIRNDILTSLTTFLSIIFGFYITSLAIFVTSKYVTKLYQIEDENDSSKTLLHTLVMNYRIGLVMIILSILYFLFLTLLVNQTKENFLILSDSIYLIGFFPVIALNFFYSFEMLWILLKIILQESKLTK